MIIDLVIAGGALLWAILGYMSGAIRQIFKITVIVASYFAAKPISKMFVGNIQDMSGLPTEIAAGIALVLVWFIVAIILSIISSAITRKLFDLGGSELRGIDSIGGLLISSLKYLAIIYVLIASILSFKTFFNNKFPELVDKLNQSRVVGFIENNNFLKDVETVEYPSRLSKIAVSENVLKNIVTDCYRMKKSNMEPKFCNDLIQLGIKNKGKKVTILDKEFTNILKDPVFKKYIMSEKVGLWLEQSKKK